MNGQKITGKNVFIRICFLILVAVVCLVQTNYLSASEAYYPLKKIEIETAYFDDTGSTVSNRQSWVVNPTFLENDSIRLVFYLRVNERQTEICEISINKEESQRFIALKGKGAQKGLAGKNGFLIVSGYPVPCDILPVYQTELEEEYVLYKNVGGSNFSERYTIQREDTDVGNAVEKGWIQSEENDGSLELMTVTVYDNENKPVLMQVWKKNAEWWLYEETPYRKSWRTQ